VHKEDVSDKIITPMINRISFCERDE